MRPILITKEIHTLAAKYAKNLFLARQATFIRPVVHLRNLANTLGRRTSLTADYKDYVLMIIALYRWINLIKPQQFQQFHDKFFDRFTVNLERKIKIGKKTMALHKHISFAMRYDAVRDQEFLPYVRQLGIRTCVYCNANYALSISTGTDHYGKFELDHYWPQSKFPYLCTNFYNLTPCCSNCNKYKLNKESLFSLYEASHANLSPFEFELEKKSIVKYMLSQDLAHLNILFKAPLNPVHATLFKIGPTYDVLKDVAEELVWKHKIYNQNYLDGLKKAFGHKFNTSSFHRFLLGNYDQAKDIHKRPLAKLTQDIAKQLKIIK